MQIIGETRPIANTTYTYAAFQPPAYKPNVKLWMIEYNGKIVDKKTEGNFKFHPNFAGKTVKLIAIISQNGKDVQHSINLTILGGMPQILSVEWRDVNNAKIVNRTVGYLDKVTLIITTKNIPANEILKITIYEDEYADGHDKNTSRNMGTYDARVNNKGIATVSFTNIKVYQKILNDKDYIDEYDHEFYAQIVYTNKINEIKDKIQLKIRNELVQLVKPYTNKSNNPAVVGQVESQAKDSKIGMSFTFGVFIDGTLNNMYNTEMKQRADGKDVKNPSGIALPKEKAKAIYNKVGDLSYKDSSYENDLSNPAILFKNYTVDYVKTFKIYTEGIGTHTSPLKQGGALDEVDYKKDDLMEGPAFGAGNAGIKDKVRKSIDDIVDQIKISLSKKTSFFVESITFDVFGFSRGAAAARHFVHVVNHPVYIPKAHVVKTKTIVRDLQDRDISQNYKDKSMPQFGYLGMLLQEANLLDVKTKVFVRFVGIYDTVPHHGLVQGNDYKDLGLDNVNKANYVVHMVAADEHRYNFDLVDISSVAKTSPTSGKKGGIELTYPGVHCDVGGAYVEGDSNEPLRIDVGRTTGPLEDLKADIVKNGWFKKEEMEVKGYASGLILAQGLGNFLRLEGKKKYVSNQYSYIPLHIMAEFCRLKNVGFNKTQLENMYKFTPNKVPNNVNFLTSIKENLWNYSFNGGKIIKFTEAQVYHEPPIVYAKDSPKAAQYQAERNAREIEGQKKLDAQIEEKNKDIKNLRYHYLHWNSTYSSPSQSVGTFISGKNKPNIKKGKRKRDVH